MSTSLKTLAILSLSVAALACAPSPEPGAVKSAGVSDAEIAAIVVTANRIDAELGDFAVERASQSEVKQFGRTMATDHRAVNQAAGELVARLKVTPVEGAVSQKLEADAASFRSELSGKTGAAFDHAYIAHEVDYHKAVIAAVDQLLIPNADNIELKNMLVSVRPALVAHLEHAEQLLASMQ
jgi:putative membrane protein